MKQMSFLGSPGPAYFHRGGLVNLAAFFFVRCSWASPTPSPCKGEPPRSEVGRGPLPVLGVAPLMEMIG